ncbi:hypothetical protein ACFW08_24555 [Streptomyces sp. NPDC058960]|uniref:hypothetical protein n=1 Tax=Streptomyces sp. NPDC058960 TaxID=3346679 RepID=UPI003685D0C4
MLALIFTDGALAKATLLLHFAEERTDWQAAGMPTQAIDWKYAIGAEPTDTGIDASVLSRRRCAEHVAHPAGRPGTAWNVSFSIGWGTETRQGLGAPQ